MQKSGAQNEEQEAGWWQKKPRKWEVATLISSAILLFVCLRPEHNSEVTVPVQLIEKASEGPSQVRPISRQLGSKSGSGSSGSHSGSIWVYKGNNGNYGNYGKYSYSHSNSHSNSKKGGKGKGKGGYTAKSKSKSKSHSYSHSGSSYDSYWSYYSHSNSLRNIWNYTGRALLDEDFAEIFDYLSKEDQELITGSDPCDAVGVTIGSNILTSRKVCQNYLSLPYTNPECNGKNPIVPKIFHSVGHNETETYYQIATAAMNPEYLRHHLGDHEAMEYIRVKCGDEVATAYSCLAPPAYRGDLFRFCALYADGGVYLDQDIFPLVHLGELYSPCSVATVGHDFPWAGKPGKQMKILAGAPGAPIFKCAMDRIVDNVRSRNYPASPLDLSGPGVLNDCYEQHSEGVAVTYHDTRNAKWPFTGMRRGNKILAYEVPSETRHMDSHDLEDYNLLFSLRKIYRDVCPLEVQGDLER